VAAEESADPATTLGPAQFLMRTLRHEVGDFLQLVYSTVSLLDRRLPENAEVERTLTANLRARAAACKVMLDTAHDLVCAVTLDPEQVDLTELAQSLVTGLAARYPHLQLRAELSAEPVQCWADRERLTRVGSLVVIHACEMAQRAVLVRIASRPEAGEIDWTVADDGPGVPAEQMDNLFRPFSFTRHGRAGLGLAPARKVVELHGGRIAACNGASGGLQVTITLPVATQAG
jgi:signal transduction histidine kinase